MSPSRSPCFALYRVSAARPSRRGRAWLATAIALLLSALGCRPGGASPRAGGACDYADVPGTCRIESIEPSGPNAYGDGYRTLFGFVPDSDGEKALSRLPLRIGDGQDPPQSYLEANRIAVGRELRCIRRVLTKGTCTPQVFVFPELKSAF
ncbi:MAG: hypothetical protein AB1640_17985 [bacterium]